MAHPLVLPLQRCSDPSLVGEKAAGLARLLKAGFPVPAGCCVTTTAYHQALGVIGFLPTMQWNEAIRRAGEERRQLLHECRSMIRQADVSPLVDSCLEALQGTVGRPETRWAVRSSATHEDTANASFAGLYRTELGVSSADIGRAIKDLWASIWDESVMEYMIKSGTGDAPPAMAVILQRMLDAQVAGVAYSIHPVTGRDNQVMVNAVRGLGLPLVDGSVTPDQYVLEIGEGNRPGRIHRRIPAQQSERLVMGAEGLRKESLTAAERNRSSLSESQLFEVARLAKRIERAVHGSVDLEWLFDAERLWVLQARPITAVQPSSDLTDDECEWSRANFKETMPEVPSPMGLSFLEHFMEAHIVSHYRRLGCRIPGGLSSVRTLHGRPYLNVTLFHNLVGQLRGKPSLNVEQMGGESLLAAPPVRALGWFAFLRAGWLMWSEMRRVVKSGPAWFAEMKELASIYSRDRIGHLSIEEIGSCLDGLGRRLDRHEATFGIAGGVGQCLQTFSLLLPSWFGEDWRTLLNAALQGQGTVISAQQIVRMAELVEIARHDDTVSQELRHEGPEPGTYRKTMRGTQFLASFDRYLEDYGHRGLGESDVMSPRFADQPEALLDVIRVQLRGPASTPADIVERQRITREEALATIRARCGRRIDRWFVFQWWYRRLCRFFALREANRHHLMFYSKAIRNLLLRAGEQLVERGIFAEREDIFFITMQERAALLSGAPKDWAALVRARRAERECWIKIQVPDTVRDWEEARAGVHDQVVSDPSHLLRGIPISPGLVTGTARLVRSPSDWGKVQTGDIIVAPVIDPGMAPLFGIAAGLIVEMGGTLSHGAIIAREYGLPAVANVTQVTSMLADGERVMVDAGTGEVTRLAAVESGGLWEPK